jgi:hypothetical protein
MSTWIIAPVQVLVAVSLRREERTGWPAIESIAAR